MKIRKNDNVMVISGNSKGKTGKVLKVYPDKSRLIIEGVNIMKRHSRPSQRNPQGGITQKEGTVHISNVMLLDPKTNKPTRVGTKLVNDATTGKKNTRAGCRNDRGNVLDILLTRNGEANSLTKSRRT